ncbi:preprotein translocase subunit YajC [Companilactobacillus kimchiensis]
MLLMILLLLAAMYFLSIRPQKKQKAKRQGMYFIFFKTI